MIGPVNTQSPVNDSETSGSADTGLTQPCSPAVHGADMPVYPDRLHAYLIAKRTFYGAKTPIGHRCSNVVELLDERRQATGDQLRHIDANLARFLAQLEALCAEEAIRPSAPHAD